MLPYCSRREFYSVPSRPRYISKISSERSCANLNAYRIGVWDAFTPRSQTGIWRAPGALSDSNSITGLDPRGVCRQMKLTSAPQSRWENMTDPFSAANSPAQLREDLLATITAIALDAGEKIMEVYGRDFEVAIKPDESPVTEADTLAEALITERLQAAFPEVTIIAEEAVAEGYAPECGDKFFLVDPLDGSKEFVARNGEFTVNIALIHSGVPVAGVVYAPALGRIWWGAEGLGAWVAEVFNGAIEQTSAIAVRPEPATGVTLVSSRSHGSEGDDDRLTAFNIADCAAVGSSLKFCLVAEGQADLYPRFGRTMEWDTAAGDAVLRAAGGRVLDLSGKPLLYGKRNQADDCDFANCHFWALGDPALISLLGFKPEN